MKTDESVAEVQRRAEDIRRLFMVENEGDLSPVAVEDMPETVDFQ